MSSPIERARDDERAVYIISVAAELAGVHPQTLRIYERKGCCGRSGHRATPGGTRSATSSNYGGSSRSPRQGVNLAGVKMIMEMQAEMDELRGEVERLRRAARPPTRDRRCPADGATGSCRSAAWFGSHGT